MLGYIKDTNRIQIKIHFRRYGDFLAILGDAGGRVDAVSKQVRAQVGELSETILRGAAHPISVTFKKIALDVAIQRKQIVPL
jgi:hypothetical protein